MTLPDFVCVQGARAGSDASTYCRGLLATDTRTDQCAGASPGGYRKLVSMLLPEAAFMTTMAPHNCSGLCRRSWHYSFE
jgi:hypothetical protein